MRMAVADAEAGLLHRVSSIVSSELSVGEILGEVLSLAAQATACDACLIYLFDCQTNEMVLHASQVPHAADLGKLRIKMGEGVTGWVAEHRAAVALKKNAFDDPRFKHFQTLIEDTYEVFLSVPLVSAGDLIGVINAHHRLPHEHTGEEIAVMKFIGEQLGVTISKSLLEQENARLMEETAEIRRELETRKIVERAKGLLQQKYGISEEDAYFRLRNQSRRLRRPMRALAEAIILSEDLDRDPSAGPSDQRVA
ncbi:MAG: ANTAR domain-containing protein [Bryobacteraceae bacterium]